MRLGLVFYRSDFHDGKFRYLLGSDGVQCFDQRFSTTNLYGQLSKRLQSLQKLYGKKLYGVIVRGYDFRSCIDQSDTIERKLNNGGIYYVE